MRNGSRLLLEIRIFQIIAKLIIVTFSIIPPFLLFQLLFIIPNESTTHPNLQLRIIPRRRLIISWFIRLFANKDTASILFILLKLLIVNNPWVFGFFWKIKVFHVIWTQLSRKWTIHIRFFVRVWGLSGLWGLSLLKRSRVPVGRVPRFPGGEGGVVFGDWKWLWHVLKCNKTIKFWLTACEKFESSKWGVE